MNKLIHPAMIRETSEKWGGGYSCLPAIIALNRKNKSLNAQFYTKSREVAFSYHKNTNKINPFIFGFPTC